MSLSARYSPAEIEERWYAHWNQRGYFRSVPDDREPFTIVIPPPNVTGVLHMGHMLNNTIQDILIRKARMDGKNACWVPGTDHASIATEAKVVRWLREEKGLRKGDLSRDAFMEYAYQWKDKYGGIILQQLKKLGASCDWERTAFTMDPGYYRDVIRSFVDLYKKGKLYRGQRMVNWDPEALTVLSNEEVIYQEENAQLYHIHYPMADGSKGVVIATQRPETIFADVAVAVHPDDERYAHLQGKRVVVPLTNRAIPVIFDTYVDPAFGTGALKITPAHDPNDYELGIKHSLPVIDILTDDGRLNEACAYEPMVGTDRFEARKRMKGILEGEGLLMRLEDYRTNIGRSERTNAVVEPKLSLQWFVNMSSLGEPALRAVMDEQIRFFPPSFQNLYRTWMENLRDWCVSRQLWWGHRIPAYYLKSDPLNQEQFVFVAESAEEAVRIAREQTGNPNLSCDDLRQDEDVLDTWASSWLWPISVFDGFNNPEGEWRYYYPTNVLVTGWDILFFWVARMIMAGYEFKREKPFQAVYFTGMVRDKQRRKMSKSLGNSPDALLLIETYGADGVRYGLMSSAAAGGDILFDDKLCENGRNFCNKLWNALRLVKGWAVTDAPVDASVRQKNDLATTWIDQKFNLLLPELEANFRSFRLSEALLSLYGFIWDDFCAWYLEMIKPAFGDPIDRPTLEAAIRQFSRLMVALHPFMPFITEELWHQLEERPEGDDCILQPYPTPGPAENALVDRMEMAKTVIGNIRDARNQHQIKPKEALTLRAKRSERTEALLLEPGMVDIISKLAVLKAVEACDEEPANHQSFIAGADQFFIEIEKQIDVASERLKLQEELQYQQGFLRAVQAKLQHERFVSGAPPAVVEAERKKEADALQRIRIIESTLKGLG